MYFPPFAVSFILFVSSRWTSYVFKSFFLHIFFNTFGYSLRLQYFRATSMGKTRSVRIQNWLSTTNHGFIALSLRFSRFANVSVSHDDKWAAIGCEWKVWWLKSKSRKKSNIKHMVRFNCARSTTLRRRMRVCLKFWMQRILISHKLTRNCLNCAKFKRKHFVRGSTNVRRARRFNVIVENLRLYFQDNSAYIRSYT